MSGYAVWGWGEASDEPTAADLEAIAPYVEQTTGEPVQPPQVPADPPALPPSRRLASLPPSLRAMASDDPVDRARHAVGRSYRDLVRAMAGRIDSPPDLVLRPTDEQGVVDALSWASDVGAPVVPFGGGSSVVGGVEPRGLDAAVSLDLSRLAGLVEVDEVSRAARLRAGTFGPAAEAALKPHGLTLRFYPQSFERSTVGGWVATRAAGHFSTRLTHVDDLVESVRAVTPSGVWESRRLPGSGAGPSPDRMLLGSEGTLGVITEAWVRVRPRPTSKRSAGVRFATFAQGAEAVRALAQSGLRPSNCRLIDPLEAQVTGAADGSAAMLVLGFEAPGFDVTPLYEQAVALCREHGGEVEERGESDPTHPGGAADAWRGAFLRAPYLRDTFVAMGVLSETFETSITWERFDAFHEQVVGAVRAAAGERALVSCRFTHVHPDGPAPYFTVLAPARRGEEVEQWAEIKAVASDAVIAGGGTITHHHAVGRDHRPWYDRQRPDPFAAALRGAKAAVDPTGLLNPGVLIDP